MLSAASAQQAKEGVERQDHELDVEVHDGIAREQEVVDRSGRNGNDRSKNNADDSKARSAVGRLGEGEERSGAIACKLVS